MTTFKNPLPSLQIEIWSDVQCPFCYIGKTQLDKAIDSLGLKNDIQIRWKSYQLDPTIPQQVDTTQTVYEYLAERKGWPVAQSKAMHEQVAQRAKEEGLNFDFDKSIIANSFSAHCIMQKASELGLGHEAEEQFFKGYFTEGRNLGDLNDLYSIGTQIGLTNEQIDEALNEPKYASNVTSDIEEAQQLGVNGVPFFVINRQYAVSGAQGVDVFKDVLRKIKAEMPQTTSSEGAQCSTDGLC
jgi:predicted DsbA family dithiol-disulfide isomerase